MKKALAVLVVWLVPALALAGDVAGERPDCVHASATAVMTAFGYDHVVRIENTCSSAMRCLSHTSSAPSPVESVIERDSHTELSLFRGSPASEFSATVACQAR